MKRSPNPFTYPFVVKQVQEFITVSVPDLEITVADYAPKSQLIDRDYVTTLNTVLLRAAKQVLERMTRLEEAHKKPYRPPSFVRHTLQTARKDTLSTAEAAKDLGVSPATLKRWELSTIIEAVKTPGGHRSFSINEIERVKEEMTAGRKPRMKQEREALKLRQVLDRRELHQRATGKSARPLVNVLTTETPTASAAMNRAAMKSPEPE